MSAKWKYVLLLLVGWVGFDGLGHERGNPIDQNGERLLIIDHGLHVGLVFERSALEIFGGVNAQALLLQFPQADWFEFGWGDKGFYQGAASLSDVSFPMAARALFWPTKTVMHVATGSGDAALVFAVAAPVALMLSAGATQEMLAGVEGGFASMVPTGAGLYAISRFYPGRGRYHVFQTCNNWASQILRRGGIGASAIFAGLSWPLVQEMRWKYGV